MHVLPKVLTGAALLILSAAAQAAPLFTYSEGFDNSVTVSNTDLLQTNLASTASSGSFGQEGSAGIAVLTDGLTGSSGATGWTGIPDNASITYTLNTSVNTAGYDITTIDIFTGWGDKGRVDPNVTVSYATVGSPTFVSLGTAFHANALDNNVHNDWIQSHLTDSLLASGVSAIKFDFGPQQNTYVGYRELDVIGAPTGVPEPSLGLLGLASLILVRRRRA